MARQALRPVVRALMLWLWLACPGLAADCGVEIWPVFCRDSRILTSGPIQVDWDGTAHPHDTVRHAVPGATLVHSTSWRWQGGQVRLTYLAVVSAPPDGGTCPDDPALLQALQHLSFLLVRDPDVRSALGPEWTRPLADFPPCPFRELQRDRQAPRPGPVRVEVELLRFFLREGEVRLCEPLRAPVGAASEALLKRHGELCSTSWRTDGPVLILTYAALLDAEPPDSTGRPIPPGPIARGSATEPGSHIPGEAVARHALRTLAWDAAGGPAWSRALRPFLKE
ncbi:MAG: hypothetical protein AB1758_02495 [Candidatus Eremiobacterota bacterium]